MFGQLYRGTAEILTEDGQLVTRAGIVLEGSAEGGYRVTGFSPHQRTALGKGGDFILRIPGREDLRLMLRPGPARGVWRLAGLQAEVRPA